MFWLHCGVPPDGRIALQGEFVGSGYIFMTALLNFGQASVRFGRRSAEASLYLLSVERIGPPMSGSWRLRWDLLDEDKKAFFGLLTGDAPIPLYAPPITQPTRDHAIDVLRNSASGENLVEKFVARCSDAPAENEGPPERDHQ